MSEDLDRYYQLLGLEPGAALGDVMRAYSRLVLREPPAQPAELQALNEAYEGLQRHFREQSAPSPLAAPAPRAPEVVPPARPARRPRPAPAEAPPRDAIAEPHPTQAYWETGNADTDLLPNEGVTLDDATLDWLKKAAMIGAIALVVYAMVAASRASL